MKLISGLDDHSRYCVIATVVRRGTARAVCRAFMEVICGAPVTKVAWLNHATVAPPMVGVPVLCAQVTRAVTRVSTL